MGLKRTLREALLARGIAAPDFLVPPRQRPLHEELRRLRRGDVVVDLGANVGRTVALWAARGCIVHAFEPNPDAFARLLARTGGLPGVRLHQAAVGGAAGRARLFLHHGYQGDDEDHLESSSLVADKGNVDATRGVDVEVLDAADVLAAIPGPIAFVKIDVEGAEYDILRRLIGSEVLDRVARIAVETHADRIPSLQAAHAEIEALIAAGGLGDKIRFGWE